MAKGIFFTVVLRLVLSCLCRWMAKGARACDCYGYGRKKCAEARRRCDEAAGM